MEFLEHYPLAPLTTLGVGGTARYFCEVKLRDEWLEIWQFAKTNGLKIVLLGGGSNLFFGDFEIDVLVVADRIFYVGKNEDGSVVCGSGTPLSLLVSQTREWGMGGIEALAGLPGRVGGAVFGNAGIPQCEIGSFVEEIEIFDLSTGEFQFLSKDKLIFSYRSSSLQAHPEWAIVSIKFRFLSGQKPEALLETSKNWILERKGKQPGGKSAGSWFKNTPEKSAGWLLDQVGAKGVRVGGAFVSDLHANFILNDGTATAADFEELENRLVKLVFDRFGVRLEREVRKIV